MRRALRHIVVFGLLGVVMSYAVALGTLALPHSLRLPNLGDTVSAPVGARLHWSVRLASNQFLDRILSDVSDSPDYTKLGFRDAVKPTPIEFLASVGEKAVVSTLRAWPASKFRKGTPRRHIRSHNRRILVVRSGWPCRSSRCEVEQWYDLDERSRQRIYLRGPEAKGGLKGTSIGLAQIEVVPFWPLWLGLVLNSTFYGAILCGLWFGPNMIRRGVRRRRGLCVGCGYDLRGSEMSGESSSDSEVGSVVPPRRGDERVCPECGARSGSE